MQNAKFTFKIVKTFHLILHLTFFCLHQKQNKIKESNQQIILPNE